MLSSQHGFVCADPRPTTSLAHYGVQDGGQLDLKPRDLSTLAFVKTVTGQTITLEGFSKGDLVADFMWRVAELKAWDWPDPMRLICGGQSLTDHMKTIEDYGVAPNADVHMVPTMRRG
jgi:hypothetical protein